MLDTLSMKRARPGANVLDAIRERRAVRGYTSRKVEREVVRALLEAAVQAPSAMNEQPWSFVVIQDREQMWRHSERAKELVLAELEPGTPRWDRRALLANPAYNVFYDAGTLILVCATTGTTQAQEDCCLAAQNLMLAAHAFGLGSCPVGFARGAFNEPLTKRALGIPESSSVVMPIIVGYPRLHPDPTPRREPHVLSWS